MKISLFSSSTCRSCNTIKTVLDNLGYSYDVFMVEDDFKLSRTLGVRSVPTIKIMKDHVVLSDDYVEKDGDCVDTIVGLTTSLKGRLEDLFGE